MKLNKGLVLDTQPLDQPAETYPFGKNGVSDRRNTRENEPGFRLTGFKVPYGIPIGVIETYSQPVVFCTDNIHSAIGYYNTSTDTFQPILDDTNLPFSLGFSTANYITGEAQRNYLGDTVIAFTDKSNVPRYLNCDNPNIKVAEDLYLFPTAVPPTVTVVVGEGGALLPGAYFAAVRYLKNDGTVTAFLRISDVVFVSGQPGVVQNSELVITLTGTDPNYDIAEIVIISKVNGAFDQQLMDEVQLSPTTIITYTGTEETSTITLDEVLQNAITYDTVGAIGQLNDYLYVGDVTSPPEVSMQPYATLVNLKWASQLNKTSPVNPLVASGQLRGFMHREVYAFYIQYSLAEGGWSRAFHIPGPALISSDLQPSSQAAAGGMSALTYQIEDTISSFDPVGMTGTFGKWQNQHEFYPTTDDYDATSIGGPDLRGQSVRHFRFPSLRWCKQNLYSGNPDYGRASLDILGLQVDNIIIPSQYSSRITGYRILYAQRNSGNSTVIAQSQYLLGGRSQHGYVYDPTVQAEGGPFTAFLSSGGNWFSEDHTTGGEGGLRPLYPDPRIVRFHAFDLLFNQPSVSPSYICNELKLYIPPGVIPSPKAYMNNGDNGTGPGDDGPICLLLDYLTNGSPPTASDASRVIRKVLTSQYVPANLITSDWTNTQLETCFGMTVQGPEVLHLGTPPNSNQNPADDPTTEFGYMKLILHLQSQPPGNLPLWEYSFLTNLMFLREDLYLAFTGQDLVIANSGVTGNGATTIMGGGDTFISDYSFNNYGWIDAVNNGFTGYNDPVAGGMRICRRFSCETAANLAQRFIKTGSLQSDYYPASPLIQDSQQNYLVLFNRTLDPNDFGYSKDANTLNTLVSAQIFSSLIESIYQFPDRVHRGGFLDPLDKRRNWRSWDPLDFYELEKRWGSPVFICGIDDRLLIHCQKALFLTQDKTQLESSTIAITLGAGDIFQFPPQPGLYSKLGYGGNQSDLACLVTPLGYIFVDQLQGQIFLWKGQLRLLNEGLNTFLRDALRVIGVNTFTGNGIILGYDPYYKRVLLTVKNVTAPSVPTPVYQATPAFISTLVAGESIVVKDGRLQRFLGVNTNPNYGCEVDPVPVIGNYSVTIPDNTAAGTVILHVAGVNVDDVYIDSGNTNSTFSLDAAAGNLKVSGALSAITQNQYVLQCLATNQQGFTTTFTITVNLTATQRPPVVGDQELTIPENVTAGTILTNMNATDPQSLPLTYAITSGNTGGAFSIDGTGNLIVATPSAISYEATPIFLLAIAVFDGVFTTNATVKINVSVVIGPPPSSDVVESIYSTAVNGTQVADLSQVVTDSAVQAGLQTIAFDVVSDPSGGAFAFTSEGLVTVANQSLFNPTTTPQYIIQMRATPSGNIAQASLFRLIINILYDPSMIAFAPAGASCVGGSCSPGYVLSPDGTTCLQSTTIPATGPTASPISTNSAVATNYDTYGGLAYAPYAPDGSGTITQQLNSAPWNNPASALVNGFLNRCGLWGTSPVGSGTQIGFSVPITLAAPTTLIIALSGNNACQLTVDGNVKIFQLSSTMGSSIGTQLPVYSGLGDDVTFRFCHFYPLTLPAGTHYIGLTAYDDTGVGVLGAEIFNNTIAQLMAATLNPAFVSNPGSFPQNGNHYSNLNLLFSTRWMIGQDFNYGSPNAYVCPPAYGLDPTQTPPQCINTVSVPATTNTKKWSQVQVIYTPTSAVIATLTNQSSPQDFQGITVPYYAPVANHMDCGGTVQTFLSAQKSQFAIRNNCDNGMSGSTVTYYVQAGRYMSTISQADADSQATADATTNAQAYANQNGTCS